MSGLAAGIDAAAHRAAVEVDGRTLAVVGTGLRRVCPPDHGELQERIVRNGAVLSQFWPDAPPTKSSFPMRNAVMAGLAVATVVEAGEHSGARIQARLALQHGRHLFLHERLLAQGWARELARRPGTTVIAGPGDVLDRLTRLAAPRDALAFL